MLLAALSSGSARADALAALSDSELASASGAVAAAAADLDGDGILDLAAAFPGHVLLRFGDGSESVLPYDATALSAGEKSLYLSLVEGAIVEIDPVSGTERIVIEGILDVTSAAAGDFDGDGAPDLLVVSSGALLEVHALDGTTEILGGATGLRRLVPGDFSGQGGDELVLETVSGALLIPDPGGEPILVDAPELDGLAALDPDGDGREDVAGLLQGEVLLLEPESSEPSFIALEPASMEDLYPFLIFQIEELFRGTFLRGDPNSDASVDISDAISILLDLFAGVPARADCRKALDVDDSGILDTTDAIRLLDFLFRGGPAPPAPFPEDGEDPTADAIPCS
jgi:hypothetical protein